MITMYFGSPGSGKTTLLVKLAYESRFKYDHIYANFPCYGCEPLDMSSIGEFTLPPKSLLLIDEAGIMYNNRNYKAFPHRLIQWLKLHRHYKVDVVLASQSWEDVDITFRRMTDRLFYLKKIGAFTIVRRVSKYCTVDEDTHQIVDGYRFGRLISKLVSHETIYFFFRPPWYQYFNSYSAPVLPYYSSTPSVLLPHFSFPYLAFHPIKLICAFFSKYFRWR